MKPFPHNSASFGAPPCRPGALREVLSFWRDLLFTFFCGSLLCACVVEFNRPACPSNSKDGSSASDLLKGDFNIPNSDSTSSSLDHTTNPQNDAASCGPNGCVSTYAGRCVTAGFGDGIRLGALFDSPTGIAIDKQGTIYIADRNNNRIRRIIGDEVTTLAGSGKAGSLDGQAKDAEFFWPVDVAVDSSNGAVYVSDQKNHRIRKILNGQVSSVTAGGYGFLDGPNATAKFAYPAGIAVDSQGFIAVADTGNHLIRLISSSNVSTLAGSSIGHMDYDTDPLKARFNAPWGVIWDAANLYVLEKGNSTLRKIEGTKVSTLAGIPANLGYHDGGANAAQFKAPHHLALDGQKVYMADAGNHCIRLLVEEQVSTVAGNTKQGFKNDSLTESMFNIPTAVAVLDSKTLLVVDQGNHCIRRVSLP